MLNTIYELDKFFNEHDEIYIYGTGSISLSLFNYIEKKKYQNKIIACILTNTSSKIFMGVPVYSVNELKVNDSATILIATKEIFQKEISEKLLDFDIKSFFALSDNLSNKIKLLLREEDEINLENQFYQNINFDNETSDKNEILLISPPYWDVYAPFSAVPSLIAFLNEKGIRSKQIDLGIECFHTLIQSEYKRIATNIISEEFYKNNVAIYKNNIYESYDEYKEKMWFLKLDIFPFHKIKECYDELDIIQQFIINTFYVGVLDSEGQEVNVNAQGIDLEEIVNNTSWLTLWKTLIKEKNIKEFSNLPLFVGISATSMAQFTVAIKLASIIKKISPNIQLVLGGSSADLFIESIYPDKKLIFNYFNYVIIGEGETALFKLYNYILKREGNLLNIPNLSFIDKNGNIRINDMILEDVETLPTPDYSGLDLNLYVAPRTILPYQASRGCHYGYCAFCNHNEKYRHNYRAKSAAKVVFDLIKLKQKYNSYDFQFVDEAIQPKKFKELVLEMEKNPDFLNIKWLYYSRVSLEYNDEILQKAYHSGLKMVMFGVESLNNRLLQFIKKGIIAETSSKTLKLFHKHNVRTFAWMMCNLPSETIEEVREDIQNLQNLSDYIDAVGVGMFSLEINTDMYKNPEKFNILSIDHNNGRMFSSYNNGKIIDKKAMIDCFREEYWPMVKRNFISSNRYFIYFKKS